jgi:Endoplasmic Reticulum Oxidoreductin 1 (ERO1)
MSSKCSFVTLLNLSALSLLSSTSALVLWQQQNIQHSRYARTYSRIPLLLRNAVTTLSNNEELLPGITAINESNDDLNSKLSKLCDHLFFRLFSIDILASCEYMPQELFECYTETCEIYPEDEEAVSALAALCLEQSVNLVFNDLILSIPHLGPDINTCGRHE